MNTESLIQVLASDATPVRPLLHPAKRYLYWLSLTLTFVVMGTAGIGLRADLLQVVSEPYFLLQVCSLLLLALTAAASAFRLGVPDRRAPVLWWLPALALISCMLVFLSPVLFGSEGHAGTGLRCLRNILLLGLPPAAVLYLMLRKSFALAGNATGLLAFLGSFALACLGTRFICPREGELHFLVWHCMPVIALAGAGAVLGHLFLRKL
jgi:hypothetical protein